MKPIENREVSTFRWALGVGFFSFPCCSWNKHIHRQTCINIFLALRRIQIMLIKAKHAEDGAGGEHEQKE